MDDRFENLLMEYVAETDGTRRKEQEARLWREFGSTRAVLVMDLSGFSTLTEKYGIVYNLAIIHLMQRTARPLIEGAGGTVVKFEADNCFAMFEGVSPAVQSAVAIHRALQALSSHTGEPFNIRVGIGIDYGEVLLVGEGDFFGLTVNRASKLGEDLAGAGDILISEAAFRQIPPGSDIRFTQRVSTISGMDLTIYSIEH